MDSMTKNLFFLFIERCEYMIAIPREPKPDDLPELELDGE